MSFISRKSMMAASAPVYSLPQRIETASTTLVELDSTDGWSVRGTGDSLELNESEFVSGNASVKSISSDGGGASGAWIAKSGLSLNFGGSPPSRVRFSAYIEDENNIDTIYIELVTSNTSNFVRKLFTTGSGPLVTGWNTLEVYPAEWSLAGSVSWSDTFETIRLWNNRDTDVQSIVSFDRVSYDYQNTPSVLISFDDSFASDYTHAFNYMSQKNVFGTSYIISGFIGDTGKLTESQLLEMDAAGWSIANHTDSGSGSYANCRTYLDGLGLTDASRHAAYPGGGTEQAPAQQGMLTARNASAPTYPAVGEAPKHYEIGNRVIGHPTTLETAKGYVDEAIANNRIVGLSFHQLVDSGASTGNQWNAPDFYELIDYIISQDLPFLTINDLYDSISGPIEIPKPVV